MHTREDVVMVYSQLSSLNHQIRTIKALLALLVAIVAYAVFR